MLVQKRESPIKNIILTGVLVVVLGVSAFLLYRQFYKPKLAAPVVAPISLPEKAVTSFDTSVFSNKKFTPLLIHGEYPLEVKATGNREPFRK